MAINQPIRLFQQARRAASTPVDILPLVVLRVVFGGLMGLSMLRFLANGWVDTLYVQPDFHFTYYGFGWVQPLPEPWLSGVYALLAGLGVCIMLGWHYRLSMGLFFLLFTYTELLDQSYYLNHYYFVSLLSFLLLWLPLHRASALDVRRTPTLHTATVPRWTIGVIRLQLALVYIFAGIAKLHPDWLFHALPLRIWLLEHTGLPVLGFWLGQVWVAYAMSWAGAFYDLTIPCWLSWQRTRLFAYATVLAFHFLTALLFPIGMFPWIMIGCTLIFFEGRDLRRVAGWLTARLLRGVSWQWQALPAASTSTVQTNGVIGQVVRTLLLSFFVVQVLLPLRHWLYPGDVLWTEAGFRFSWRVMLVEKTGHATFYVTDPTSAQQWELYPSDYLTPQQAKQMAFQPDMLLAFAHYLEYQFRQQGYPDVQIRADVLVSMNGRPARRLIDPAVDLSAYPRRPAPYPWVLP